MKAKELASLLMQHPEAVVLFGDEHSISADITPLSPLHWDEEFVEMYHVKDHQRAKKLEQEDMAKFGVRILVITPHNGDTGKDELIEEMNRIAL